jgi:hypothetical protein
MKNLLLSLAAAALIPLSISGPFATRCVGHGGIDPCVTNGDKGAALQQCEDSCNNAAPVAPAPKGPGACGLDSCPDYPNQPTHGEGICAITGACTPPGH